MSTDLQKNILGLVVALLKHQAENLLGKEAIGIASNTLIDVGGEKAQARLNEILRTSKGAQELKDAALRADTYFRERCTDKYVRDAFTISMGDLPSVQAVLKDLPNALDQGNALKTIRDNLARDFPNLSKEQIENGAMLYVECVSRALLPLRDFALPIIGNAVLESKENIEKIKTMVKEILDSLPKQSMQETKLKEFVPESYNSFEELPETSDFLPPGFRLPFYRNRIFTGRNDDLKRLAIILLSNKQTTFITQTAAATGMGGIGKTQLAVEFCYRYGRYFYGVHWIDARQTIDNEVADCGREMGLPNFPETAPEQVTTTLRVWQIQPLRLIVLDNVIDELVLHEWLPKLNGLHILITGRRQQWSPDLGVVVHSLDTLSRAESLALLQKLAPRLESIPFAVKNKVAERLGDLPLALDLAGHHLNDRESLSVEEYLVELEKEGGAIQHMSFHDWVEGSPTQHETNLVATFMVSWKQLGDNDSAAIKIFIASGYLAPNVTIPLAIFETVAEDSKIAALAIRRLKALGLLAESLTVHPLLAEFARAQDGHDAILAKLTEKMEKLSSQFLETGLPAQFMPLRPHIEALVSFAEREGVNEVGELLDKLGAHYYMIGKYHEAYLTFERGFNFLERDSTENSSSNIEGRISFLANMGEMLRNLGDFPGAKAKYERALEIGENILGQEHGFIIYIKNNLGLALRQMGNLEEAKSLHETVLTIGEKVYGKADQNVAIWIGNLGAVLHNMSDFSGAKTMYERALEIHKNVYGEKNPAVAIDFNNLGVLSKDMGDYSAAKALYERALAIQVEVFGDEHPDIALSLHNLAVVFISIGELPQALDYEQRALSMREKFFPPNHQYIQKSRETLLEIEQKMRIG